MRVVLTTVHDARVAVYAAFNRMLGKPDHTPPLPPDDTPVYLVVAEGDFRIWPPSNKAGNWLAVYVLTSFRVQGFQLTPPGMIPPLDLDALGTVHQLPPLTG